MIYVKTTEKTKSKGVRPKLTRKKERQNYQRGPGTEIFFAENELLSIHAIGLVLRPENFLAKGRGKSFFVSRNSVEGRERIRLMGNMKITEG